MSYITKIVVIGSRDHPSKWRVNNIPNYPSSVKIIHQIESETLPEALDDIVYGMVDVCEKIIQKSQKDNYAPSGKYYYLQYNKSWEVTLNVTENISGDNFRRKQIYQHGYSNTTNSWLEYLLEENKCYNDLLRGLLAYAVERRADAIRNYVHKLTEAYFYQNTLMLEKKEEFKKELDVLNKHSGKLISGKISKDDQVSNYSDYPESAVSYFKKFNSMLPPLEKHPTFIQKMFNLEKTL